MITTVTKEIQGQAPDLKLPFEDGDYPIYRVKIDDRGRIRYLDQTATIKDGKMVKLK